MTKQNLTHKSLPYNTFLLHLEMFFFIIMFLCDLFDKCHPKIGFSWVKALQGLLILFPGGFKKHTYNFSKYLSQQNKGLAKIISKWNSRQPITITWSNTNNHKTFQQWTMNNERKATSLYLLLYLLFFRCNVSFTVLLNKKLSPDSKKYLECFLSLSPAKRGYS